MLWVFLSRDCGFNRLYSTNARSIVNKYGAFYVIKTNGLRHCIDGILSRNALIGFLQNHDKIEVRLK
jgi:hypothetical protein